MRYGATHFQDFAQQQLGIELGEELHLVAFKLSSLLRVRFRLLHLRRLAQKRSPVLLKLLKLNRF